MTYGIHLDKTEADRFIQAILQRRGLKRGMLASGLYLKAQLAVYPPHTSRPQPFKTDKSRRGFFAKLRAGEIEVPYKRGISPGSQTLGRRWAVTQPDELTTIVGNNAGYGALTQGDTKQTFYHKTTGWITPKKAWDTHKGAVGKIVSNEIKRSVREM